MRRKFSKHVDVFNRAPNLTETAEARIRAESGASYSMRGWSSRSLSGCTRRYNESEDAGRQ